MIRQSTAPRHFDALTGIRGIAAWWVVSLHFHEHIYGLLPQAKHLKWVIDQGGHGVSLFFLLSGLILIHTYQARFKTFTWREYRRYLWFRFARIYPAYLAALVMMIACVIVSEIKGISRNSTAYPLSLLPWEALMLHQWVPHPPSGWNFPDWSVSAEWFAYIVAFPCTLVLLKRLKNPIARAILVTLLVTAVILFFADRAYPLAQVTLLFVSGGLLWGLRQSVEGRSGIPRHTDFAGIVTVLAGLWLLSFGGRPVLASGCVYAGLCVLLVGLSHSGGLVARFLACPPMVFLGEVSYSVYLTHGILERIIKVLLPYDRFLASSLPIRLGVLTTYGALVLATAIGLYFLVERPARQWLREVSERWPKPGQ